jgi:CBS domain-containing protein
MAQRSVRETMTSSVISVRPEATVQEVARTLRENRVHRVLVADQGRLVGIITAFDLIALVEKQPTRL